MTAWSRAGSLTSDRLRPRSVPQQQQSRNKNQGKNRESSKSKDVQKLERILDGLRQEATVRKDATGGCFCQGTCHLFLFPLFQIEYELIYFLAVYAE